MRVAIVSYYAPPDPAVASHRGLRLTRSLIDAGHEVHWVTLDAAQLLRSDETLRRADNALYEAKKAGCNTVLIAPESGRVADAA